MGFKEIYDGMLPKEKNEGKIGFYPVMNKEEWEKLPAVYKAMEWEAIPDPLDKEKRLRAVKNVIFSVGYMEPYGIRAEVAVHPQEVQKLLFNYFRKTDCQLYSVCAVELEGRTKLPAKWLQDSTTGAFAIALSPRNKIVGRQGGFGGHIPECIEKTSDGEFKWKGVGNYNKTNHYTFSNPFMDLKQEKIAEKDGKELLTSIEALSLQHTYKVPGNADSYSQYNEGWSDCSDKVLGLVESYFDIKKDKDVKKSVAKENSKGNSDVVSRLINAMADYAFEHAWNDSDMIDALANCGVSREDFEKAGYGEFVKPYYEDELEGATGYQCKCCGETIYEDTSDPEWFNDYGEEELWGHIQRYHEDIFEECQDWETPTMLEEYFDRVEDGKIIDKAEIGKDVENKRNTIQHAMAVALKDGYDQFVLQDNKGEYSFTRAVQGKPVVHLCPDEKVVGKVMYKWVNGCPKVSYEDVKSLDEKLGNAKSKTNNQGFEKSISKQVERD